MTISFPVLFFSDLQLMNIKHLIFFLCLSSYSFGRAQAHKPSMISDSLWYDHLNELIKCASTDQITERISKTLTDSSYIAAFKPSLRLTNSPSELIKKEYNKVSYSCYLYTSEKIDDKLQKHFLDWYAKIKKGLTLWSEARLKNNDTTLTVPDDYFFTNSEDETAVRLDIYQDKGYHVRLRIF